MIAGHTDMPVGTAATMAGVATCIGSDCGSVATTGAITISGGSERRTRSLARYVTNATAAAIDVNARTENRIGFGTEIAGSRATARSFASRRARKLADGSIRGRLRTSIRLRRIRVSSCAHSKQTRMCSRISCSSCAEHIRSTKGACRSRNSLQSISGAIRLGLGTPCTTGGFRTGRQNGAFARYQTSTSLTRVTVRCVRICTHTPRERVKEKSSSFGEELFQTSKPSNLLLVDVRLDDRRERGARAIES